MPAKSAADSLDDIALYYQNNGEAFRFQRQQLEYLVTLQLLVHYLPSPCRILELGAGAGAYTVELARAGHEVVANDLSETLLKQNEHAVKEISGANVTFLPGEARAALRGYRGKPFDAILVMGPLYHLIQEAERRETLEAVCQAVRPGGKILSAHMSRTGYIKYVFQNTPDLVLTNPTAVTEVWQNGFNAQHPRDGHFRGYWTTPQETKALVESAGLKFVQIHSQDAGTGGDDEVFNTMPMEQKLAWSNFLFRLSADPNTWGDARHFLCVSERP